MRPAPLTLSPPPALAQRVSIRRPGGDVAAAESSHQQNPPIRDRVAANQLSPPPPSYTAGNAVNSDVPLLADAQQQPHGSVPIFTVFAKSSDYYESLDYDEIENVVLQEARRKHGKALEPARYKVWAVLVISGMLTGLVAFCIDKGIGALNVPKFLAVEHFMGTPSNSTPPLSTPAPSSPVPGLFWNTSSVSGLTDTTTTTTPSPSSDAPGSTDIPFFLPFVLYISINLAYAGVAAGLVIWGEPVAKGSGIPEVKCYLNGIRIWRVVRLKTLFCKACGILFSVASGLPVGKEGPMVHSGAAIASGIASGKSSVLHCDTGFFRDFRSDSFKRKFVTAGSAAGVGAAFGAPVGGLLFAVEEVGSFWNLEMTVMVFICAAVAPWVLQILQHPSQWRTGQVSGLIDFGSVTGGYNYRDLPFVCLLGLICGGLGAIFVAVNLRLTALRKRYVTTKLRKLAEVFTVSALVSGVLISLVLRGYNCVDVRHAADNTRVKMKSYGCPAGQYNDMATYFFRSMEDSISLLIHEVDDMNPGTLIKQLIPYFLLTTVTYGINVPSGLFLPMLSLGANIGHLYAQVCNAIIGERWLDPAKFALYGGTGMLGGALRMTISVIAIVMEATSNATLFYPLVVVTVSAKFFGDLFNRGIFDEHINFQRIPLLETHRDGPEMALMTAGDVMNATMVRLTPVVSVRVLLYTLRRFPFHNVLVIVDEHTGVFRGLLLRRSALILIDKRAWEQDLIMTDFTDTAREEELFRVKKYGILDKVREEDLSATVDLTRYADQWPFQFHTTTPVPRIYRTFRELGLRHIVVFDDAHRPVGLIGRRQLCKLMIVEGTEAAAAVDQSGPSSPPAEPGSIRGSFLHQSVVATSPRVPRGNQRFPSAISYHRVGGDAIEPIVCIAAPDLTRPLTDRDVPENDHLNDDWEDAYRPEIN